MEWSGFRSDMVPVTGLEPVRCRQRWILSPLRLPIPSHRPVCLSLYCGRHEIASIFSGPNVNNIRCLVLSGGYLSLTAVPYAMTSAAPCITEEEP